mgnify:CR=1 FL=1
MGENADMELLCQESHRLERLAAAEQHRLEGQTLQLRQLLRHNKEVQCFSCLVTSEDESFFTVHEV